MKTKRNTKKPVRRFAQAAPRLPNLLPLVNAVVALTAAVQEQNRLLGLVMSVRQTRVPPPPPPQVSDAASDDNSLLS